MSEPKRIRRKTNLTLSDLVKAKGPELAKSRGMSFSQLVEQMIRTELIAAGKIAQGKDVTAKNHAANNAPKPKRKQ